MKELKQKELEKVTGGISIWGALGIISSFVFIVGVISGIANPVKCN